MKANRIILCLKDNELRQFTAKNLHMDGNGLYFNDLHNDRTYCIPLNQIDRIDVFHIDVDPITKEPLMPSTD